MNKGFTIIETLIAIVIFGLISTALFSLIANLYQTHEFTWHQASAIEEARRGIKTMIREIRSANIGESGSYVIEKADDSEFIFFSDIDKDGKTERVRYFLGGISSSEQKKDCVSYVNGGTCSVAFSNFYQGTLKQAQVQVSVEGDFGLTTEYAEIFVDGFKLGELCKGSGECNDCPAYWQGTATFNVTQQATDNNLQFLADASSQVDNACNWQQSRHSMKAQFVLSWTEIAAGQDQQFKKGVVEPVGTPPQYPLAQEKIKILSHYVQNNIDDPQKAVFKYFDKNGQEITQVPARPEQTTLMQLTLIINVDLNRQPDDYLLQSKVQLRNLMIEEE